MSVKGVPVVIVDKGGVPVNPVDKRAPLLTESMNGMGLPITISDKGAPFIIDRWPVGSDLYFDFLNDRYFGGKPDVVRSGSTLMEGLDGAYQEFGPNVPALIKGKGLQVLPQSTRLTAYPRTPFTNWSTASAIKTAYSGTFLNAFSNACRIASGGAGWHRLQTPSPISWALGSSYGFAMYYSAGTSGRCRIVFRNNTDMVETIVLGPIGALVVFQTAAGTVSNLTQTEVQPGIWLATGTFTPNTTVADQGYLAIGPDSNNAGEDVIFYGGWIESTPFATPPNFGNEAGAATRPGDLVTAAVPDGGRAFVLAVDIKGRDANGRYLAQWSDGSTGNRYTLAVNSAGTSFSLDVDSGGSYVGGTPFSPNGPVIGQHFISGVARGGYVYAADLGAAEPSPSNLIAPLDIDLLGLGGNGINTSNNAFSIIEKFCEADVLNFASSAEARAWAKSIAQGWAS